MGFFNKDKQDNEQPGTPGNDPTASLSGVLSQATRGTQAPSSSKQAPETIDEHGPSEFGETVEVEGSLEGYGDVVLRGSVTGSIHITGRLVIAETGRAKADVAAREVLNSGTVEGNILASDKVRVDASGTVQGNIDAPSIVIEDGGGVDGFVEMAPGGNTVPDEVDDFVPPPPIRGDRPSATSTPPPVSVAAAERTAISRPEPDLPPTEPMVAVAQQAGSFAPVPSESNESASESADSEHTSAAQNGTRDSDDEPDTPRSAIFSKKTQL